MHFLCISRASKSGTIELHRDQDDVWLCPSPSATGDEFADNVVREAFLATAFFCQKSEA